MPDLWEDEPQKHCAVDLLVEAECQIGGHRQLCDIDRSHSDPLRSVNSKGDWERVQAHLPATRALTQEEGNPGETLCIV